MMFSKSDIYTLLHNRTKQWDFPNLSSLPHPYTLRSCEQACEFLAEKMCSKTPCRILVVGDYDVDGVIASVVMMKFFALIHYKHIEYVIPSRFHDGYGVSKSIIQAHPSDVIITVDNGITAYEAASYCKEQGIPLIITDHHIPKSTLPEALFIINPQQKDCNFPQKEICGALVAWYFCAGLKIALHKRESTNAAILENFSNPTNLAQTLQNCSLAPLLELVMLATIADMMPLTQINKCIVLYGIKQFYTSSIPALQKLKTRLRTPHITATDISFSLTPLLNAAGRMGEGRIASEFLLLDTYASTYTHTTLESALDSGLQALLALNQTRKDTAKAVLESAKAAALVYDKVVITMGEEWHEGVLGIVAAQMAQFYEKPAFVLSFSKVAKACDTERDMKGLESTLDSNSTLSQTHKIPRQQETAQEEAIVLKGSARSWGEVDIMAILLGASEILGEFGGHSKAAGLSVDLARFEAFCAYLQDIQTLPQCAITHDDIGVLSIRPNHIDTELFAILDSFEPYGQANPKPIFEAHLRIKRTQIIKEHKKFNFYETPLQGMCFYCDGAFAQGEQVIVRFSMQLDPYTHKPMMIIHKLTHAKDANNAAQDKLAQNTTTHATTATTA